MKVLALLSAFMGLFFGIICFFILQLFFPEDAFLISAAAAIGYYIILFPFLLLIQEALVYIFVKISWY